MEIIYALGALAIFIGLIYGAVSYKRRDKRLDPLTERATRELRKEEPEKGADLPSPETFFETPPAPRA